MTVCRDSQLKAEENLQKLAQLNREMAANAVTDAGVAANRVTTMTVVIGVTGGIAVLILGVWLARKIGSTIRTLIDEAARAFRRPRWKASCRRAATPNWSASSFGRSSRASTRTLDSLVTVIDRIPAPVMVIDKEFSIRYMNDAGANVIGLAKDKIVGTKCYEHFKTPHCKTADCACAEP